MSTEPVLIAEDITVKYGSRTALDSLSITLNYGDVLGVVGANGAGKSTLMKVLSGAVQPDSGSITLAGEQFAPQNPDEAQAGGVGYIPQHIHLDPDLTVAEAIFRTSFRSSLPFEEQVDEATRLLSEYGVDMQATDKIAELVPAEITTVEILRIAAEETVVILLDEVTAGFNDHEISLFHALATRLASKGRALVHVSHRIDELQSLSNRIAVITDGTVSGTFIPRDTHRDEIVTEIFGHAIPEPQRPAEREPTSPELLKLDEVMVTDTLRPTTLAVHAGEVVGITGMRRSGITRISQLLSGAIQPDAGRILIHRIPHSITDPQRAAQLGIINISEEDEDKPAAEGQTLSSLIMEDETEQLTFAEEVSRVREVIDIVQDLGVKTASVHEKVETLSGGDQQKLRLAQTLRQSGKVYVLNQPTKGVDERSRIRVYEMIRMLADAGSAVVLISSDMTELTTNCHRVAIMRDNALVDILPHDGLTEDHIMVSVLGYDWTEEEPADGSTHAI